MSVFFFFFIGRDAVKKIALIRVWPFVRTLKSVWGWSVDTSCNTPSVASGCQAVEQLEQFFFFFSSFVSMWTCLSWSEKGWGQRANLAELVGTDVPLDRIVLLLKCKFLKTANEWGNKATLGDLEVSLCLHLAVLLLMGCSCWQLGCCLGE